MGDKQRWLILGGTGFIGRHLVKYLVRNDLAAKIRVVDKVMPALAYLTPEFEEYFNASVVEFKQANLGNPAHLNRAFDDPTGGYDIVVNLAAETKYGQAEDVYKQLTLDVAVTVANEAVRRGGVQKFVQVSTAQIYDSSKKCAKEEGKMKPWTNLAKYSLEAEEALKAIPGLPLVILRPAICYGPGDQNGIMPRVICAAAYTQLGEKMKFLWGKDLRVNTVHVSDVAHAIHHVAVTAPAGSVFNVCDKGDTNQKTVGKILERLFNIKTDYYGSIMSNLAKLNFEGLTEEANDKHMTPWSALIKEYSLNTPLSPFLAMELLYNNPLSVDGSALEASGFVYQFPEINDDLVRESVQYWVDIKAFPPLMA